jgi:hypothetical protein
MNSEQWLFYEWLNMHNDSGQAFLYRYLQEGAFWHRDGERIPAIMERP